MIRPIRNDEDHAVALKRIDALWGAEPGSDAADELEILITLVDDYESTHHPIGPSDPVAAILFRMEQGGHAREALDGLLGGADVAEAILSRRQELTLVMVRRLHREWGIPADVLISPSTPAAA